MSLINVPLVLSYDTRGVASYAAMQAGKDQRRINCHYPITRNSVDSAPEVALARRPGVTVDAGTYGAATQVQYLVGRDPAGTWNPTPWVYVKDGTNSKAVTSATAATILNDTNYYPRFSEIANVNGTNTAVVVLQNSASPAGTPAQRTYYSTAIGTWTEITDTDFTGLSHRGKPEFMDGYMFQADSRNRIYHSDVNSITAWTSTSLITKSVTSDPPQGLIRHRGQILFGGVETIEGFYNAGNATGSVLSRITGFQKRIGIAAVAGGGSTMAGKTHYYCTMGDITFFLGRYAGSKDDTSLIAYNGSDFQKLSRPYEDTLLSSTEIYSVNAVSIGGKPAVGIQMTAPSATTQIWLMFFPDINEWFEWSSTVFGPVNNSLNYTGATDPQKLYSFAASDNWQDAGTSFTMTAQFRLPARDLSYTTMSRCGVIADTVSSSENLGVQFSDNDGASYTTARNIDLSLPKKELHRCGMFRERLVRLTHSGSKECRLRRFYADVL